MRFLSGLFKPSIPTDLWPGVASDISKGFLDIKQRWFNQCVVAMDLGLLADKEEKAKVVHDTLGGTAALAITAFQICCASKIILKNAYTPQTGVEDFVDLLCSRVSGVEPRDLSKYIKRYDEVSNESSTQRFRFGVDVAGYVINGEPSMLLSLQIASLSQVLSARSCLVTADAFADSREARQIAHQITMLDRHPVINW